MIFDYRSSEQASSLGVEASKAAVSAKDMDAIPAAHRRTKEVVLQEGVKVVENLILNTDEADCAQFITEFKVEKDGKNLDLEGCGKENIRCHYDKAGRRATVVTNCGGNLPRNARIRLEIGDNSGLPFTQFKEKRRILSSYSVEGELVQATGEECYTHLTKNWQIKISDPIPIGAFISINVSCTLTDTAAGLEEFDVVTYTEKTIEFVILKPYTSVLSIPDRKVEVGYWITYGYDIEIYDKQDSETRVPLFSDSKAFDRNFTQFVNMKVTCDQCNSNALTVMEPTTFTITFTPTCYIQGTIYYSVKYLTEFERNCSSSEVACTLNSDDVDDIDIDRSELKMEETSLKIVLTAPSTSTTVPLNFTVRVRNSGKRTATSLYFYFPINMKVVPKTIDATTLDAAVNRPKIKTAYTFEAVLNFEIEQGSSLQIDFNPSMAIDSSSTYSSSFQAGSLTVNDNSVMIDQLEELQSGSTFIVQIEGVANPSTAGTHSNIFLSVIDPSGAVYAKSQELAVEIECGELEAAMTADSNEVLTRSTYTFLIEAKDDIYANGKIEVTLGLAIVASNFICQANADTLSLAGSCTSSGNAVTFDLLADVSANSRIELEIEGIINPPSIGTHSDFFVAVKDEDGDALNVSEMLTLNVSYGKFDATLSATPNNLLTRSTYAFLITARHIIPANAKIVITLGSATTASDLSCQASVSSGGCTVVGNVITLNSLAETDANAAITLTVEGIMNPDYAGTCSDVFVVITDSADNALNEPKELSVNIDHGKLGATLSMSSNEALTRSTYTLLVTPKHLIPANSKLVFTLDSATVASDFSCQINGVSVSAGNCAVSGSTVVFHSLQEISSDTATEFRIEGIINPPYPGTYSGFSAASTSAAGELYSQSDDVAATVESGKIEATLAVSSNLAQTRSAYTFLVTPKHLVPQGSKAVLTLGAATVAPDCTCQHDVTAGSCTASGNIVTLDSLPEISANSVIELKVEGVINPNYVGACSGFFITIKNAADTIISKSNELTVNTNYGNIYAEVAISSSELLTRSTYTFLITPKHSVFANDQLEVILGSATISSDFTCQADISAGVCSVNGNAITLNSLPALDANTVIQLRIEGVFNPSSMGTHSGLFATVKTVSSSTFAKSNEMSVSIDYGKIEATMAVSQKETRTLATYTFSMKLEHRIPDYAKLELTLGSESVSSGFTCQSATPIKTCTASGSVVTVSFTSEISASTVIALSIKDTINPPYMGTHSGFFVVIKDGQNNVMDKSDELTVDITKGKVGATMSLASNELLVSTTYTFSIKTNHPIYAGDKIEVILNSVIVTPELACQSSVTAGTCVDNGYGVTLPSLSAAPAGLTIQFVIQNVVNPPYEGTNSGIFVVMETGAGETFAESDEMSINLGYGANVAKLIVVPNEVLTRSKYTFRLSLDRYYLWSYWVNIVFGSEIIASDYSCWIGVVKKDCILAGNTITVYPSSGSYFNQTIEIDIEGIINYPYVGTHTGFRVISFFYHNWIYGYPYLTISSLSVEIGRGRVEATLAVSPNQAQTRSTYIFRITPKHLVQQNNKIQITLGSATIASDFSCESSVPAGGCTTSGSTVTLNSLSPVDAGSTIELKLLNVVNPHSIGTSSGFFVTMAGSNNDIYSKSDELSISVDYGQIEAEVSVAPNELLTRSTYTFLIKPKHIIAKNNKIQITLGSATVASDFTCQVNISAGGCTLSGNVVTLNSLPAIDTAATIEFKVKGVINPPSMGTHSGFFVEMKTEAGATFAKSNEMSVYIDYGQVTAEVAVTPNEALTRSTYTFRITPKHFVLATNKIEFTLGSESVASDFSCQTSVVAGDCTVNGNAVTLDTLPAIDANTVIEVSIEGVVNSYYVGTHSGFFVSVRDKNSNLLSKSSELTVEINRAKIDAAIAVAPNQARTRSTYTFLITPKHYILSESKFEITLSSVAVASDYSWQLTISAGTCAVNGNTIIIDSLPALVGNTNMELKIEGVINPHGIGTYSGFFIAVKSKTDDEYSKTDELSVDITYGRLETALAVSPNELLTPSTYTFQITPKHFTLDGEKLEITLNSVTVPSDFSCQTSIDGALPVTGDCTVSKDVVTLNSLPAVAANSVIRLDIEGVVNPNYKGTYSGFFVNLKNKDGDIVSKSEELSTSIDYGKLEASLAITSIEVLTRSIYTFVFTPKHYLMPNSKFVITLSSAILPSDLTCQPSVASETCVVSGNAITVTPLVTVDINTAVEVIIKDIINPPYVGPNSGFFVTTKDAVDVLSISNELGITLDYSKVDAAVTVTPQQAQTLSTYTFLITPRHFILDYSKIEIVLSSVTIDSGFFCQANVPAGICTVSGNTVNLQSLMALNVDTTIELNLKDIINPYTIGTNSGFFVTMKGSVDNVLSKSEELAIDLEYGEFEVQLAVSPNELLTRSTHTFYIVSKHVIFENDKIEVTLNAAWIASDFSCNINVPVSTGGCTASGNKITLVSSGRVYDGTAIELVVEGVVNPYYTGIHSGFFIRTKKAADYVFAISDELSVDVDYGKVEAQVAISPNNALTRSTYTFLVKPKHFILSNSNIEFTLGLAIIPSDFACQYNVTAGGCTASGDTVILNSLSAVDANTEIQVAIEGIINPYPVGTNSGFFVTPKSGTGEVLSRSEELNIEIDYGKVKAEFSLSTIQAQLRSTYTFLITPEHYILENGKIEVTLDSTTAAPDFSCQANVSAGACTANGHTIILESLSAVDAGTTIELVIEGLINPYDRGDYDGFFVTIRHEDGSVISKSEAMSVFIDYRELTPDIQLEIVYQNVFEEILFNFSFKIKDFEGEYSSNTFIDIALPDYATTFTPLQAASFNLVEENEVRYQASGMKSQPLIFIRSCVDPVADLESKPVSFVLIDHGNSHRATGEVLMSLKKGYIGAGKDFLVECMHRYPELPVRCNLTYVRTTNEPIKTLVFYGELIKPTYTYSHLSDQKCAVTVDNHEVTCTYDEHERTFIVFDTPVTDLSFKIIDMEYINPNGSERDSMKYAVRTYETYPALPNSVVARCEECLTALVDCDFPCNTCQDSAVACTSCVIGAAIELYVWPQQNWCYTRCPDNYFIDARRVCRPCPKNCKSCSFRDTCDDCEDGFKKWNNVCHVVCPLDMIDVDGECKSCSAKCLTCQNSPDFCTACKNRLFNYEGECYDECVEGTGRLSSAGLNYCLSCGDGCGECTHAEGQPLSTVCTKCAPGYSSAESSPPLACSPARRLESSSEVNL